METIVQRGHKALSTVASEVPLADITSPRIQKIIKNMRQALATQADGVGLAAPQIGVSLRIFIVSGKIFHPEWRRFEGLKSSEIPTPDDLVFINPEIVKLSKKTKLLNEGCLSVRPYYGDVERSLNATVRAWNEKGEVFVRGASGLLAHIFQHEVDHLNGILFIDKAINIHEPKPLED